MEVTSTSYPSLKNNHVFITGGATGIGAAMVESFAQQGCHVAYIDINREQGESLATQIKQEHHVDVWFKSVDVTDISELKNAIDEAVEHFGNVDCLINNAANDARQPVNEVSASDWQKNMSVNLDPVFFATQHVLQYMKLKSKGSVINFSSLNALHGAKNLTAYSTAKAGILGLTKSLAAEVGEFDIRVNAVVPGWVATDKQLASWLTKEEEEKWMASVALKKRISPAEVAKLVLFLASDDSAMITGQALHIDGGKHS